MSLQPVNGAGPAVRPRRARLSDAARRRLQGSVPDETFRAYKREVKKFEDWCAAGGEIDLPCATDTLTNWVADRADAGDSVSAIKQGISAVVFFHDQANVDEKLMPDTGDAWRIVSQYKKERADKGYRPMQAAIVNPEELRRMVATLPPGRVATLRDRAILTVGMSSFARRSNLVRFDLQDLVFLDDGDADMLKTYSKTDQEAEGHNVTLPPGSHELSDPVGALRAWVDELTAQGITDGPLFRRVSRSDNILPYGLDASWVNTLVKTTAKAAGLTPPKNTRHSAHTLRGSGASAASQAGASTSAICDQGGWSKEGTQVHIYIRPNSKDNAMRDVL
ncbi:tyrosine-type recombinase/integrase (plasmid) [Streptomyces sp. RLB1-9]|uniref:tyrosine-type recombinase/integrase n=1 Tax=Streptomyces sp. RLB1-9 TaxID=2594454 RepID=UPI0011639D47|nr:tyrosine-type recombinase/integrase [Streptomyces sp. RLB1-9]QDN94924.1 tyrosine-type recombinase/integrase [Streptomyces sp. RLB1-9]